MDILRNILDENDPNYVLWMKLPALATLAGIISISMFFYSIFVVFAFIHQNPGVVITLIIIHSLILIMVLWSFARVFFSDPGYVKRTLRLESLNANPRQSPDKLIGANEKNQIHEVCIYIPITFIHYKWDIKLVIFTKVYITIYFYLFCS